MSQSTRYHVRSYLATNPARDEVLARVADLTAHLGWIDRNMGEGMDGGARASHKTSVEISMLKEFLATGAVAPSWED